MDFSLYQSYKLLGASPSTTHKHGVSGTDLTVIRYIGKIWNGRQKVKFPIAWDFPHI